jgi:hypothetical protein
MSSTEHKAPPYLVFVTSLLPRPSEGHALARISKGKYVLVHAMKARGEVEIQLHAFIILAKELTIII